MFKLQYIALKFVMWSVNNLKSNQWFEVNSKYSNNELIAKTENIRGDGILLKRVKLCINLIELEV